MAERTPRIRPIFATIVRLRSLFHLRRGSRDREDFHNGVPLEKRRYLLENRGIHKFTRYFLLCEKPLCPHAAIDDSRLFVLFERGYLAALSHNGETKW